MSESRYNSKPSQEDIRLFHKSVGTVKRASQDRIAFERPRPAPVPTQRLREERQVMAESLSGSFDYSVLETGEELLFAQPQVKPTVMRKLRLGHYSIGAELDLHGMTAPLAREALSTFLNQSRAAGHLCVLVIHGKGNGSFNKLPVLKGKLSRWLRQRAHVLAFCSARPVDGGTGAVYVLLKRR
jgi:DNA-nicking Smr family endonuclease